MVTTHAEPEAAVPAADVVVQLRIEIAVALGDIAADAHLVEALTDSHQRRLGILTPAAEVVQNDLSRKERRDRNEAQRLGLPTGTGDVAAPGNFAGIAVAAEIYATLQHQVRACNRVLERRGICSVRRIDDDPSVQDLVRVLANLVLTITSSRVLHAVRDDLAELQETVTTFVDAVESSTPLNADCPHCGRCTLIARFHEDLIRCERDPRTHHYEACVCSDPLCECKTRPTSHRHEWHRPRPGGGSPTWYALRDRLNLTRLTKKGNPTR